VLRLARIAFASATGSGTRRCQLSAARHRSEHAEVLRPVMASPHTGQGQEEPTTTAPACATAARSDSESGYASRIVYWASVKTRESITQSMRLSGKLSGSPEARFVSRVPSLHFLRCNCRTHFLLVGHWAFYLLSLNR
jgi:hypothetical protein